MVGSEFREAGIDSWLDPQSSRRLSVRLGERLARRFRGKRGLFFSLTYNRDAFDGPLDCYRKMSDERHVRRFMERLSEYLGVDLAGKWICKLEFQMGDGAGWPHFHLMIEYPKPIPHADLARLWGHGFVFVSFITSTRCRYFAKYIAKADDVPAWILGERPRSVKVIRTSPHFWGSPRESSGGERPEKRSPPCCYVTVGMCLERRRQMVICRSADGKRWRRARVSAWEAAIALRALGVVLGGEGRWLRCEYGVDSLVAILEGRAGPAAKPRPGPLHLINSGNPPQSGAPEWAIRSLTCQGAFEWREVA